MMRFTSVAVVALSTIVIPVRAEPPKLEVGEPFPVMRLPSIEDGRGRTLPVLGKKTVLHVFASW